MAKIALLSKKKKKIEKEKIKKEEEKDDETNPKRKLLICSTHTFLKKAHPGWFYKNMVKAPHNRTLVAQIYGGRMWSGKILFEVETCFLLYILPLLAEKSGKSIVEQYYRSIFIKEGLVGIIGRFKIQDVLLKYDGQIVERYFNQTPLELNGYLAFTSRWVLRKKREEIKYRKQLLQETA